MSNPFRPRAEDEDIRDTAAQSLAAGQDSLPDATRPPDAAAVVPDPAAQSAPEEAIESPSVRDQRWNLNEEKRRVYEEQVRAAEARRNGAPSAQAYNLAADNLYRRGNRAASRVAKQDASNAEADERFIQNSSLRLQEQQVARNAEIERDNNAKQAQAVREHTARGGETAVDPATGRKTIASNEDGSDRYKVGEVGKPFLSEGRTIADAASGILGGGQDAGAIGATGGGVTAQGILQQTYRNEKGDTIAAPLESKTDPKTGEIYQETKDEFGKPQRFVTGTDPHIARKLELQKGIDNADLQAQNLEVQRLQLEPQWKPIEDTYHKAKAQLDAKPDYIQSNGKWVKNDEKQTPAEYDPQSLEEWRKTHEGTLNQYKSAAKQYGEMLPTWQNLDQQRREARMVKEKLQAEKMRLELGLPEQDGGISKTLVAAQTGQPTSEDQEVVNQLEAALQASQTEDDAAATKDATDALKSVPGYGAVMTLGDGPVLPPIPAPTTPETDKAFQSIKGLQGVTLEKNEGFTALNRNGKWFASLEDSDGKPLITLRDSAHTQQDIMEIVRSAGTEGISIYTRDNPERPPLIDEAKNVAAFFQSLQDPALAPENGAPQEALRQRIKELGMDPQTIREKVAKGLMTVQSAQTVLASVYKDTLESPNLLDPKQYEQNFQRYLTEQTQKADSDISSKFAKTLVDAHSAGKKYEDATTGIATSIKNQQSIRQDFISHEVLKHRGKPGWDRQTIKKLYTIEAPQSLGQKAQSAASTFGGLVVNSVAAAMLGLAGKAAVHIGAAERELLGLNTEADDKLITEMVDLSNRDWANFTNGAKRNYEIWTSEKGSAASTAFESAALLLQTVIDEQADAVTPDKAQLAAAELGLRRAALALHNLAPDESWPVTEDTLDPAKDPSLAKALATYNATGDPRQWELYKSRLLMNNGRRQASDMLMKQMRPNASEFERSFTSAMYSGWQEPLSEVAYDLAALVTGTAAKAIQVSLKGTGAAVKAARVARMTSHVEKALAAADNFLIHKPSLQNPLTALQKTSNFAVRTAQGGVGEGLEEVLVETGSDQPQLLEAFVMGAIAPLGLAPLAVMRHSMNIEGRSSEAAIAAANEKWATKYNASMAGAPGFTPITPEQAAVARNFVNLADHQQSLATITSALGNLQLTSQEEQSAEQLLPQARRASIEQARDRLTKALEDPAIAAPKRQAIEQDLQRITERLALSDTAQTASDKMQARRILEQASTDIANRTESAIAAAAAIEQLPDPARRTFYSGIAKVATGNISSLTSAERKAVEGARTESGGDFFAQVTQPNGAVREVLTDEARVEVLRQVPRVGALIQTSESQAIAAAQFEAEAQAENAATPAGQPVPTAATPAATPAPGVQRIPATPEVMAQAQGIAQQAYAALQQSSPGLAARIDMVDKGMPSVSGGVITYRDGPNGTTRFQIIAEDIAHSVAANPSATPEQHAQALVSIVERHEATHLAQQDFARLEAAARALPGTDAQNFETIYTEQAQKYKAENQTAWEIGGKIYASRSQEDAALQDWDAMPEWQQAAEVERIFVEGLLDEGKAQQSTDIYRAASASFREHLANLAKMLFELIRTGTLKLADGTSITLSPATRARAEQIAARVEQLRNETPANATPDPNASSPNPNNNPSQPAASQAADGNSKSPESGSDSGTPVDSGTQPAPGDGTGAPTPREQALKIVTEEFEKKLEAVPDLKREDMQDVKSAMRVVAMEAAVAAEADLPNARKIAITAFENFRRSPEVARRLNEIALARNAKAKASRDSKQALVEAETDRVIAGIELLNYLDRNGYKFASPPFSYWGIKKKAELAKKDPSITLTAYEQELLARFNNAASEQLPRKGDYEGGGKNAVARAIIGRLFPENGSDKAISDATGDADLLPLLNTGGDTQITEDTIMGAIANAIRDYTLDRATLSTLEDPDLDISGKTEEQIDALIEKSKSDALLSQWRIATGKNNLLPSTARQYQSEYESIVAAEGENEFLDEDYVARAIAAVDERSAPKTAAQTATVNPRVNELSKPDEGGLVATEAALDIAPLRAIQNHLPSLTKVTSTPLVQRALALAERIIPYFQGNKLKMTGPVVSAMERYTTPEQRAAVTTLHDLFGGGGAWGMVLAEMFPNLRKIHINEFDPARATKIQAQIEFGDRFAEIAETPAVRRAMESIIAAHRMRPAVRRKIERQMAKQAQGDFIGQENLTADEIAEMNEAWSWGVINKTAAEMANSLDPEKAREVVAVLKTMADDPERSGPWFKADPEAEPTADELIQWFKQRHAPKAAAIHAHAQQMKARGVSFEFTTGDAYALPIASGPSTVVVADPPYFATTGYAENNQKSVVGTDTYRQSATLMADLVANENHVIYTDEAWWLRDKIDNAIKPADLVAGQKLAAEISNTLDFMVVADQIDSRYETLGLNNPTGSPVAASRSNGRLGDLRGNSGTQSDPGGNRSGGRTPAVEVPEGSDGQAGLQPADDGGDPGDQRLNSAPAALRPLTPQTAFSDWSANPGEKGILYGYRGENHDTRKITYPPQDNNFGGSEGIGLYIAKMEQDAEFFGTVRRLNFPEPKRPIVVDQDLAGDDIPMLDEEADVWQDIFSHKAPAGASDWIKAHVIAAKRIGLTEATWSEKIDDLPRALTDTLLDMGYDAVYVRSGGMEWVNLLAAKGQRHQRGTKSEGGQALYSAPAAIHQSLLDSIGEQALRVEQPGKSYEDKRQLLLDFAKSLVPQDDNATAGGPLAPIQVLRARVARTVTTDLQVKFIGQQIEGLEDFVEKAQVLRNPGFETFYLLATRVKNGKARIVNAMAVTSRVPTSSAIFPDGKSWGEGLPMHERFLRDSNADSYILLHNHPSGDPSPSSDDILVTRRHASAMERAGFEMIDHVVINHLTYASLDANGIITRGQIASQQEDVYAWPVGTEIGMSMETPEQIAAIAKNIQESKDRPDLLVGFFLNSNLQVVATIQGSIGDIKKLTAAQLKELGSQQGGIHLVLHGKAAGTEQAVRMLESLAPMNRAGLLTDAVIETSDRLVAGSELSSFNNLQSSFFGGARAPGQRVQENPTAEYRYLKAKQEKAGLTPAENEALLRAEKAMGQTFAFDMDRSKLSAPRGSVSNRFQPFLRLETETPAPDERQMALFSAPAEDPNAAAAFDDALRNLAPIYRDVLQASQATPTPTPQDLGRQFNISPRAVENIISVARARIRAHAATRRTAGLKPQMKDGMLQAARPDLAYGADSPFAAVDQLRKEEGTTGMTAQEIEAAGRQIMAHPDAMAHLTGILKERSLSAAEVFATHQLILEAGLKGVQSPQLTELTFLYRESGTDASDAFRARKDIHRSPAERNALALIETFNNPDKRTRASWENAKTQAQKDSLLQSWNAKVKGIKDALKNRGIDIDAALQRLAQQRADVKAAESEAAATHQKLVDALQARVASLEAQLAAAPDASAQDAIQSQLDAAQQNAQEAKALDPANTIRIELDRLKQDERSVIEMLRDGATWEQAAKPSFMSVIEAKRVFRRFADALDEAGMKAILLAEDLMLAKESRLGSAPAENALTREQRAKLAASAIRKAMGYDEAAIDRRSAGMPTKKTKGTKPAAKANPAMMSDAEFARRQNNPVPVEQREEAQIGKRMNDLHQIEMMVIPPSKRISFEQWINKPENVESKLRQERMFRQPVSTTTGELDLNDPNSVKKALDELAINDASIFDKTMEFWRMSILSGLQTGVVNVAGTSAHVLYDLYPRRILEAGVNDVLGIIGLGSKDAATMGELRFMMKQSHKALAKAGQVAALSWQENDRVIDAMVKNQAREFSLDGTAADRHQPALGGILGKLMRSISFRHMTAADEMLKAYHVHVEVAAQAYRMAKKEGLQGPALEARVEELMEYGSPAFTKAMTRTDWVTFNNRHDKTSKRSLGFIDRLAAGARYLSLTDTGKTRQVRDDKGRLVTEKILKPNAFSFFVPFINTPANIMKIGIEMSPLGTFFSLIDAARALDTKIRRGHLSKEAAAAEAALIYNRMEFVKDVTNQIIGLGMFYALGSLIKPGDDDEMPWITGSVDWKSTSKGDRDLRQRVMPAYSIRIPFTDSFISYQRIEPFGTAWGLTVDARIAVEKHGFTDKALGEFMTTFINQFENKTFMQGLSNIMNIAHDPERFATKITSSIVTGFVVNLIRQPIREVDPYIRDTRPEAGDGFVTAVTKSIGYSLAPGYAPIKMSVWGKPMQSNPGSLIGGPLVDPFIRVFDPTNITRTGAIDPLDLYLFNWNNSIADQKDKFNVQEIRDSISITRNGKSTQVPISREDHWIANERAGQAARKTLGDEWDPKKPTPQGVERVKQVIRAFQDREREALRAKYTNKAPAK